MLINKKTLEYLAELGRIELDKKYEEKMLNDLQGILGYFEELKEVNTEGVEPLAGGTTETNIFRDDSETINDKQQIADGKRIRNNLIDAFPEKEEIFLKVPPVFE